MPRLQGIPAIPFLLMGLLAGAGASPAVDTPRRQAEAGGSGSGSAPPWRLVVYFDAALASDRSARRAATTLAAAAGSLTALGSVEVALAAPEAAVRLGATRDPKLVAGALEALARDRFPSGDLLWHRDELRRALQGAAWTGAEDLRARVLAAARTEQEAIHQRLDQLLDWLDASDAAGRSAPKLLLWVTDGFDESPVETYARAVPQPDLAARLRGELDAYGNTASVAAFGEALAASGWIALPVAPGLRPFGLVSGEPSFAEPRVPLERLADATGGEVVTGGEVEPALARLAARPRSPTPPAASGSLPEGGLPPPPSLTRGAGVMDPAALGLDRARPVYLLPLEGAMATGRTRIAAQAVGAEVAAVVFRVGDEEVRTDREPPFEITVDLPSVPTTMKVQAVALDAAGADLGRDELEVNALEGELRVAIREPRSIPAPGRYAVELEVRTPRGAGVAVVEARWEGEPVATLGHPPYRFALTVPREAGSGFLHVVARLPDGRTSEDVLGLGPEGFGERVNVDEVHLAAVVEGRRGRPVPGLAREDFLVREDGREQRLRTFGSAADTPLAVGLTVDVSTSMEGDLPLLQQAAMRFLRQVLRPADRAQLVAFAERPWLAAPLTGDLETLARAVQGLSVSPNTALYDAVMLSLFHLRGVSGRKALVLLTDGRDTRSQHSSYQCSEFARRTGIPIYVIALGSPAPRSGSARLQRAVLTRLATDTGGGLFFLQRMDQLDEAYGRIAEELRHQYLLTYTSDGEGEEAGWRSVEVEVLQRGLEAKTVGGYFKED